MALDRWIALAILAICCVYGYAAWFTMDGALPPFMRRNPVWPSTFPKVLSIAGGLVALAILLLPAPASGPKAGEIDYRRLGAYRLDHAGLMIGYMVAYALLLRPIGFIPSTTLFLAVAAFTLGERRPWLLAPVAFVSAYAVWWLVQEVLGVFLRPWPELF